MSPVRLLSFFERKRNMPIGNMLLSASHAATAVHMF
jgi:hypothetical protein